MLVAYLLKALEENKIADTQGKALQVFRLVKERVTFPQDLWLQGKVFFIKPTVYDEQILKTKWTQQTRSVLQELCHALKVLVPFKDDLIRSTLVRLLEARSMKINQVMPIVRVALTGLGAGPDLMQSMELIGQEECLSRIEIFLEKYPLPCQ